MKPTLLLAPALALAANLAATACSHPPPPLIPEVQPGPAHGVKPNRVLVLQAICGSVEYHCPRDFAQTVDAIVRGGLEFAGYAVVDSDTLRQDTRQRHEEHVESDSNQASRTHTDTEQDFNPFDVHTTTESQNMSHTTTTTTVLDGSNFEDLSVDARHEVLTKSGADSVVSVRIVVGGQTGMWVPNQNVEVMVKLGVNQGDTMAWASRCMASSNDFTTVTSALENAARCAVHGATGH